MVDGDGVQADHVVHSHSLMMTLHSNVPAPQLINEREYCGCLREHDVVHGNKSSSSRLTSKDNNQAPHLTNMMIIRRVALSHSDLDLMSAMVTFLLPLHRGSSIRESANTPFGDLSTERVESLSGPPFFSSLSSSLHRLHQNIKRGDAFQVARWVY
eukprot:scaffold10963_cov84-Skeletonema_marinoi.AAC.7